jgi:hypothetical protein
MALRTSISILLLENRVPVTASSLPYTLLPGLLLFVLACLARLPNTYFFRLLLFPIFLVVCLHVAFGYVVDAGPELHLANLSASRIHSSLAVH